MSKMKFVLLFIVSMSLIQGCAPVIVAGAVTGVAVAHDRRSSGAVLDDQGIEYHIGNALYGHKELYAVSHINIISYNGVVLMTGETTTEAFKQDAEELVKQAENLKGYHNELVIAEPSAVSSRSNDTWITSKLKTNLTADENIDPFFIKVVTERGVVYLMGIVSQEEAQTAVDIAVQVAGVQRVVKIFEYTD